MKKKAGRKARAAGPASATRRARIARTSSPARRRHKPLGKQPSDPAAAMMAAEKSGMPVLILMPKGREEALATKALTRADIRTEICERPDQLDKHTTDQTGAVLRWQECRRSRDY
jgi:hypothetical protein